MPNVQNVYTIEDHSFCPDGEGKIIEEYLNGLFSRVALQVIKVGKPIDWLVIKSHDGLEGIVFGSYYFCDDLLENALKKHNKDISVDDASLYGGNFSQEDFEKSVKEKLKQKEIQFDYLNYPNFSLGYVRYHLNMHKS